AALLLAARLRAVVRALRDLDLREPRHDDERPHREQKQEEPRAAAPDARARIGVHFGAPSAGGWTYCTCPGWGGRSPLRCAPAATRAGADARARSARSRRFSSVSSDAVFCRASRR